MDFLLDTSFLVSAFKYKIDIVKELRRFGRPELFSLDLVVSELERLAERGSVKTAARLALDFVSSEDVEMLHADTNITDNELEASAATGFVVCTVDKGLLERIRNAGRKVVIIRQMKYLEMIG